MTAPTVWPTEVEGDEIDDDDDEAATGTILR
jgi:hypothetical protein